MKTNGFLTRSILEDNKTKPQQWHDTDHILLSSFFYFFLEWCLFNSSAIVIEKLNVSSFEKVILESHFQMRPNV